MAVGLVAALLAAGPAAAQSTLVQIPDPRLRAAVEDALGKDAGDLITRAEMGRLTSLSARGTLTASDQGITDTTGLQHATGLTALDLSHNSIETIDLSALTGLTRLNLTHNSLANLTVTGLTGLKELHISSNKIHAIYGLDALVNLEVLNAWGNNLASFPAGYGSLTELKHIHLGHNQLRSVPNLAALTKLESLSLQDNYLDGTYSPPATLTKLEFLNLNNNQLYGHPTLTSAQRRGLTLHMAGNRLTTVHPDAVWMDVYGAAGNRINGTVTLTNIRSHDLWLNNNQISTLTVTKNGGKANLLNVDASNNQLTSVQFTGTGTFPALLLIRVRCNPNLTLANITGEPDTATIDLADCR